MKRLIIGRLAGLVGVILALTLIVFVIQTMLPSDPVRAFFGRNTPPEEIERRRAELGYDRPVVAQYIGFLGRLAQGDLGDSLRTRRPVTSDLSTFLPATLELAGAALVLALFIGAGIGLASVRTGRRSTGIRMVSVAFASVPTFFIGILGIMFLYRQLGWFPPGGRSSDPSRDSVTGLLTVDAIVRLEPSSLLDALRHLAMPAVALALGPAVAIGRTLRGALLDELREDHIRTARSKGLTERAVLVRHGIRNALTPTLAMTGLQVGLLLAGAIVVEVVFSWPGVGTYLNQALQSSDFPAVVGVVLVLGVGYLLVNFVVDLLQLVADPRVRETDR